MPWIDRPPWIPHATGLEHHGVELGWALQWEVGRPGHGPANLLAWWAGGLVVISSCGHAGIVNTLRRAQEVSGVEKIYALVGGFHLAPAPSDYLCGVMTELKKFDIEHVLPMHCSGINFVELAKQEIPEKLVICATGSSFTFTA